jgi:enoyl-CoA hydratase
MAYNSILVEARSRVGLVTLNRPDALNALNAVLLRELMDALNDFDRDETINAIVIAGSPKAFAAGADIKEMADRSAAEMMQNDPVAIFGRIRTIQKPVIAAVSGWALGGGFELALSCDMLIASETAKFGLPEVTIGVIPGAGGTQRLPRLIGKPLAMEVIFNDRKLTASEALQYGIANRVVPVDQYLEEALKFAEEIASRAPLAVRAAKKMINASYDSSLTDALEEERRVFYALFATQDQKEGMKAFSEKRKPIWSGK